MVSIVVIIVSSFTGTRYDHRQLLVFRIVNIQTHCCHTDYQLHKSFDSQTWNTFLSSNFYPCCTYTPEWYSDLLLRLWVFDVTECLDNFVCFSLSLRTSPFWKHSVSFSSVGLPRTVCAFVSLRHDNILQQYIDMFLETALPNFIQTTFCRFDKNGLNEIQIVPHWIIHPTSQNRPISK